MKYFNFNMKLALHQPYFFPYIGYFSLMHAADVFMFFDNVQYVRKSWMSRNRILKPNREQFQYINIGLKKPVYKSKLPDCELISNSEWKNKILVQLEHYKKRAPYYRETIELLDVIFEEEERSLLQFNIRSIKTIASLLKIDTAIELFSNIEGEVEIAIEPGLWGLNTCLAFGADSYINAPGGEIFYPKKNFIEAGVKLGFIQHQLTPYNQHNSGFIGGLSIIDVLMFCGIENSAKLVRDYSVKWIN
ncbi:WbqC family protein [uncultured Draconibacterium sp.]|uniref:WbqC family protein n=1 Tax=uncultured Draconibacterium sp. TaxID=1573823 RepID=UPI002AA71CBC|nr:WbqC family protein [uncultured Draconibacterium sp.]